MLKDYPALMTTLTPTATTRLSFSQKTKQNINVVQQVSHAVFTFLPPDLWFLLSTVVGEGPTSGGAEASREIEEQLGIKRREDRDHKNRDKNKEKEKELDEGLTVEESNLNSILNILPSEIVKVYDGYNSLRKRLFRTVTVPISASKDDLLHASMKAFVVTQVG